MLGLDDLEAPGLEELSKEQLSQNGTLPDPKTAGTEETLLLDMEKFPRDSQLYWRLVVTSQGGKKTPSNMATVYLEAHWQTTTTTTTTTSSNAGGGVATLYLSFLLVGFMNIQILHSLLA